MPQAGRGWLWAAIGCVVISVAAALASVATGRPPQGPAPTDVDINRVDALGNNERAIITAWATFERSRTEIDARHLRLLAAADQEAAEQAAGPLMILDTLQRKAIDQLRGSDRAGTFLSERLGHAVDPARQLYVDDTAAALARLERDLAASNTLLAHDLALAVPELAAGSPVPPVAALGTVLTPDTLHLSTTIAIGAVDGVAVGGVAAGIFKRSIARLAAAPVIALADGPLPIGDLAALVLGTWTLWDIHHAKGEYRERVSAQLLSSRNSFIEATDHWAKSRASHYGTRAQAARSVILHHAAPSEAALDRSST